MKHILPLSLLLLASGSVFGSGDEERASLNVYSQRNYRSDKTIFEEFERKFGITVNLLTGKADELIARMRSEGAASPADVFITTDIASLVRAKDLGLLQQVDIPRVNEVLPAHLRDPEGYWYAITKRARVVVHRKDESPLLVESYEDLAREELAGRVVIRSSSNVYNISLLASIVATQGEDAAKTWAKNMTRSFARDPEGNDRDQMKAVAAGVADYAVANSYYLGLLLHSSDPLEVETGKQLAVLFPNQKGRGTHINISGIAVTSSAEAREAAEKLIEFLLSDYAQGVFAEENYEYPVVDTIPLHPTVAQWGDFAEDTADLAAVGAQAAVATRIFDEVGWQ